jgi:PIN domain nuclease of toxin-antitoxin system
VTLLLDTHLLLWAAAEDERLPLAASAMIKDPRHSLTFSAANIWEVVIKSSLGRSDFRVNPRLLRRKLLQNGYSELPVSSDHTLAVSDLPEIHKDPFDRILIAQALAEGLTLLTSDPIVASYPGPIIAF